MRLAVLTAFRNTGKTEKAIATFQSLVVQSNYKDKTESNGLLASKKDLKRAWPIQELSSFDLAYLASIMSQHSKGNKVLRAVRHYNREQRSHEILIKAPPLLADARRRSSAEHSNYHSERVEVSEMVHGVPLTVDITQDDETLKLAFSIWLAGARNLLGAAKVPIGEKDFQAWKEYGLLQVFDLEFWGKLHGIRYSDALIAGAIWPNAEFDSTERIRKVSRKKVHEVFDDWRFVSRFWRQLELSKFLKSLKSGQARPEKSVRSDKPLRKHRSVVPLVFG